MRTLLTGNEGYLGAVMGPELIRRGHDVVGLDTGFFKSGWLCHDVGPTPHTVVKDVRDITAADLEGFDAVVHLAELSNDPLGQMEPELTHRVNHEGSVHLATLAKQAGVTRFVYMSSCSVYGVATEGDVSEESSTNPQTAYAVCKTLVERDLTAMADDNFHPTFMRNATAFGVSPRLRFDLVVQNLSGLAWTTNTIAMISDGTPWRPLVHARDIAQAVACVLAAPPDAVHSEVFNVGSSEQNYQVRDIANAVGDVFPGCKVTLGTQGGDNRSYRVDFSKISTKLPGFECEWNLEKGVKELYDTYRKVGLTTEQFASRDYTRLAQLEYLRSTGQVDNDLRWVHR